MTEVVYTHRTKNGMKARIVTIDRNHPDYPVVALMWDGYHDMERVMLYTSDLKNDVSCESPLDLVPYSPWEDVAVDTKILVRDFDTNDWFPRHFSHYADGRVHAFAEGRTSWTKRANVPTNSWDQSKLAE